METPEQASWRVAGPGEINGDLFDRFTLVHFASGFIKQRVGVSLDANITIAVGFEFVERWLKREHPRAFPHPTQDTLMNQIGDVGASTLGWLVSRRLERRRR